MRKETISHSRINFIEDLANFINEEYSFDGYIDPELVAQDNSITYSYNFYGDSFDGILECINKEFHIYINLNRSKNKSSGRSRFTFCHELGHFFLDEHRIALLEGKSPAHKSITDYSSDLLVEREADIFATNLLLPGNKVVDLFGDQNTSIKLLKSIANHFETSLTSTFIRYVKLDLAECAIFKISDGEILWSWCSDSMKSKGYKYPLKEFDNMPKGSATFNKCDSEQQENSIAKTGSTASMWFNYIDDSSSKNIILLEEAISLGNYGVLTLIRPDS